MLRQPLLHQAPSQAWTALTAVQARTGSTLLQHCSPGWQQHVQLGWLGAVAAAMKAQHLQVLAAAAAARAWQI